MMLTVPTRRLASSTTWMVTSASCWMFSAWRTRRNASSTLTLCGGGEEVHAHDSTGAGGIESEQGQDLGPGAGRKQVEDLLSAGLWQLGHGVGRVIGSHVGDDLGHLGVGLVPEKLGGEVRVQLFEHVSFQFGVGMDHVEDLFALGAGGVLQEIGDLGRLEVDDPPESGPSPDAGGMADEGLEGLPVLTGIARRWTGSVRTVGPVVECPGTNRTQPSSVAVSFDVPGSHQFGFSDVDEPVTQDVLSQQDFAVSPLEAAQVDLGLREGDALVAQLGDPADVHEDTATADLGHEPDHHRVVISHAGGR